MDQNCYRRKYQTIHGDLSYGLAFIVVMIDQLIVFSRWQAFQSCTETTQFMELALCLFNGQIDRRIQPNYGIVYSSIVGIIALEE